MTVEHEPPLLEQRIRIAGMVSDVGVERIKAVLNAWAELSPEERVVAGCTSGFAPGDMIPLQSIAVTGWQCPVCRNVNAPVVMQCPCRGQRIPMERING